MAKELYSLSLDSIKLLCGLIRDLASVSEGIDNLHLADDKTFSNIYIKNLVDKCLQDANAEAEKLVGALTHLTCKETTVQPTLDNSEINVIYLYSADGNPPYQQFLKISETKLVDLGSTSINLTDYLTITSAASTYAKQTDLKTLSDEVSGIKTKIGSGSLDTTSDTLIGAINEVANKSTIVSLTKAEYDALATKDTETYYIITDDEQSVSITPSISSTSTDSEVPTALAVEKRVKNMLVCPNDKSPKEFALENCKNGQVVEFVQWGGTHADSISQYATYKMIRGTDPNWSVLVATIYDTDHRRTIKYCPYDGYRDDANKWKKWQRVVTTTVEDVPITILPTVSTSQYTVKGQYTIVNGICYGRIDISCTSPFTGAVSDAPWISTDLPKPILDITYLNAIPWNSSETTDIRVIVTTSGELMAQGGTSGVGYFASFSYPVAES